MTMATRDEVVRLTQWAKCAGCAAKMGPADLSAVLAPLELRSDPRLLVGRETFDDAGVFKLSDELALVQTLAGRARFDTTAPPDAPPGSTNRQTRRTPKRRHAP